MAYSRIQETTNSTSSSVIVLGGAKVGYRSFAAKHAIGETGIEVVIDDGAGNWLEGIYTLTDAATLTRTSILSSSNSDGDVTFGAGAKVVFETFSGASTRRLPQVRQAAFSTSIPLSSLGTVYMTQQTVSAPLTFTPMAGAVAGALVYLRLVADGTNTPNTSAFKEWGGSMGYDNRAGYVNQVQFFYDGMDYWVSFSQAVNATAIDTVPPTVSSASVASSTPNVVNFVMSEAMDPNYVPAASAFTVTGHTVTAVAVSGSTMALTLGENFVNGESRTVSYAQPASNGARDLAGNLLASFSGTAITDNVPAPDTTAPTFVSAQVANASPTVIAVTMSETLASINPANTAFTVSGGKTVQSAVVSGAVVNVTVSPAYAAGDTITLSYTKPGASQLQDPSGNQVASFGPVTVTNNIVAAGAPSAPTGVSATAGDTTATVSFTASAANGSTISGYTATATPAGGGTAITASGASSPITITGLTNGTSYNVTVHANSNNGSSPESSPAVSVTPAVAPAGPTLVSRENVTVSGGTYTGTLTGNGFDQGYPSGGVLDKVFQSGVDGSFVFRVAALTAPGTGANEMITSVGPCDFCIERGNMVSGAYVRTTGYVPVTNGASQTALNSVSAAVGDYIKFERVGNQLTMTVSKDGGATYPANQKIYTWTVSTGQLFGQVKFTNQAAVDSLAGTGLGAAVKTPIRLATLAGITEGGSAGAYTYTGNGTTGAYSASQAGLTDKIFTSAQNGSVTLPITTLGTGKVLLVTSANNALSAPASTYLGIGADSSYNPYNAGNTNTPQSTVTPASGDVMRLTRQGTATRVAVSKDNGQSFAQIKEFTSSNNTTNYLQVFLNGTAQIGPIVGTGVS